LIILSLATCMFILNLTSFCFEVVELRKQFYEIRKKRRAAVSAASKGLATDIKKRSSVNQQQNSTTNSMMILSNVLSETEEKQPMTALMSGKASAGNDFRGLNDLLNKKKLKRNSDDSVMISDVDEEKKTTEGGLKSFRDRLGKGNHNNKLKNMVEEVFGSDKIASSKVLDGDSKNDTPVAKPRKINQIVPQSMIYSHNDSIVSGSNTPKLLLPNGNMQDLSKDMTSLGSIDDFQSRRGKLKEIIAKQFASGGRSSISKQDEEADLTNIVLEEDSPPKKINQDLTINSEKMGSAQGKERTIKRNNKEDLMLFKSPSETDSMGVASLVLEDNLQRLMLRERIPRSVQKK